MLKSMTAYACAEAHQGELSVNTEIRSYNSRYLDIALRLPPGYTSIEEKIKRAIGARMVRGRVEVRISIKNLSESVLTYEIDPARARSYHEAVEVLRRHLSLSQSVTLDQMLQVPGIITVRENAPDTEQQWSVIEDSLTKTLALLDAMRLQEGAYIESDFTMRLEMLAQSLDAIEAAARALPDQYREKLMTRIEVLTQGLTVLDPVRLAQEAAIIADRSDIEEEIVRTRSHLLQFKTIISSDEASGRKLNFLLQELNREFNTMGSKIGQADIAHTIVGVKAEIEKLREQVQNIE